MRCQLITPDFLLTNPPAERLYHEFAVPLPVIDYHCHLDVTQLADDASFSTITELWLSRDHYKWRALRARGVNEHYITGAAGDFEKFESWAQTVPYTIGNPLYHWTHMEMSNPFGIYDPLGPETAEQTYRRCNELLCTDAFRARSLVRHFNVRALCPNADPLDDMAVYDRLRGADRQILVLPSFRPDQAFAVDTPASFNSWVDRLARLVGVEIRRYRDLLEALRTRQEVFDQVGCRISDHGVARLCAEPYTERQIEAIFARVRRGRAPSPEDVERFRSAVLFDLSVMNAEMGWVQQLHIGCLRNVNSKGFAALGAGAGFDVMGDYPLASPLARFLDRLESVGKLTRTIVYNLNPRDNAAVPCVLAGFQAGPMPGKLQFGPAWWFNDHQEGIGEQLQALGCQGLLSTFIGMATDARCVLSMNRHDYFRRILCNHLGRGIANGILPTDYEHIGTIVGDICYHNAARYLQIQH